MRTTPPSGRSNGLPRRSPQEVAEFGIHVILIEPSGFDTDWGGASAKRAKEMPEYAKLRDKIKEQRKARIGKQGGPNASARALFKVVDAKEPPRRVFFGAAPLAIREAAYAKRLERWGKWQPVALEAQGD